MSWQVFKKFINEGKYYLCNRKLKIPRQILENIICGISIQVI